MRRRIVAALSAGVAGLALGVLPATGAYASNEIRSDYGCSDWRGGDGRHCGHHNDYNDRYYGGYHDRYYDPYYDRHFDRNFNDFVVILVSAR